MSAVLTRKVTRAPHSSGVKKYTPSLPPRQTIDKATFAKLTEVLDPRGIEVMYHLWHKKHAVIDELAKILGVSSQMMALYRIRKHINAPAQKIIGRPILAFKEAEVDPLSGEMVPFSWWLTIEIEEPGLEEPLIDIFDEERHINIILELTGTTEEDIHIKLEENSLILSVDKSDRQWLKTILLPAKVDTMYLSKVYNNGILKVKLMKE